MTSDRDRIIGNASYLLLGNVGARLVSAIATVFVARYLGAEEYAVLSIAIAFSAVAAYAANLGLLHTLIREGTRPEADYNRLLNGFFQIRLLLALAASLGSVLVILALYPDPLVRQVVLMVTLPTIWGQAFSSVGAGYFTLTQRMGYNAAIQVVTGLVAAATLFAGMLAGWPLGWIAVAYGLATFAGAGLSLLLVARHIRLGWRSYPALWHGLWAFTLSGFAFMILPQLGPLVLGRATELSEVGLFAAAYRIPAVLYLIPGAVATASYPQLFRLGTNDREAHFRLSCRQVRYMSLIGFGLTVPLALHAQWVLNVVFGPEWVAATPALTLLAGVILLQSLNAPLADRLTTLGRAAHRASIQVAAIFIGVAGYWTLGAVHGATGGALTALALELTILAGFLAVLPRALHLLTVALPPTIRTAGLAAAASIGVASIMPSGGSAFGLTLAIWAAAILGLEVEIRREVQRRLGRAFRRLRILGR